MSLWGGRFSEPSAAEFKKFNDSLAFDYQLAAYELQASQAWAQALAQAKLLSDAEARQLSEALTELQQAIAANPELPLQSDEEDIHSWVEAQLIEKIGATAKRLHTGRSRNDLVATDLRLLCKALGHQLIDANLAAIQALMQFAERYQAAPLPGYTHLQRAQPIMAGHWALAYVQMLQRDVSRLKESLQRLDVCPLGSGALAGTTAPIDRQALAQNLGFRDACENSLDGVSDRDFALDLLHCASTGMLHLSRLAEDVVFYCSGESGCFAMSDRISSGSSLMPQKKNPDLFELLRGKTGRVLGHQQALQITLKGLPLAYNKDLQEDKEGLFDALHTYLQCLQMLSFAMPELSVNTTHAAQQATLGYSNATELADYLVGKGMPFRDAHHVTGAVVLYAQQQKQPLESLTLAEFTEFSEVIDDDVYQVLELDYGMHQRAALGGTAPAAVKLALKHANDWLHAAEAASKHVRQARLSDADKICDLIAYWAHQGENLPRDKADVLQAIQSFAVAELDGEVVGCAALYVYSTGLAEIRSLGLFPQAQGKGLGAELVALLLWRARELGIRRTIVLTRVPEFFTKLNFRLTVKEKLPEKVMKDCELCPRRHNCDETALEYLL
ncbi:Argininosuccinate lyase [Pseudidiomarina piscicola]|uniref:Argininosuccinate lyase n=1 Tax=Pseudidiomarina piscicola TaxID=2614830 RepID=A0A6S6WVC1_9GAMM|nr:argininosuccinate lyase [Pseudidiomarina piscicola]CAB0151441.1 Argininosuccinate lyase [Pseudidiomarina piscicola]VZT40920.1 Argininosuccinate lyase [Pseudomonas aeruginosa]